MAKNRLENSLNSSNNLNTSSSLIRIIAGSLKQKKIKVIDQQGLRPTPERLREALFNSLGQNLLNIKVLDLFAGSGALAFEAYSRGAEVVAIEKDAKIFQAMQKLAIDWGVNSNPRWQAIKNDAFEFLKALQKTKNNKADFLDYDLILLDPPYDLNYLPQLFSLMLEIYMIFDPQIHVAKKIHIYCEHNHALDFCNFFNAAINNCSQNIKYHIKYQIKKEWKMGQVYAYLLVIDLA